MFFALETQHHRAGKSFVEDRQQADAVVLAVGARFTLGHESDRDAVGDKAAMRTARINEAL